MGTKSISSTKLKTHLYETLKLPKQFVKNAKKEKVVSASEIQLKPDESLPEARAVAARGPPLS